MPKTRGLCLDCQKVVVMIQEGDAISPDSMYYIADARCESCAHKHNVQYTETGRHFDPPTGFMNDKILGPQKAKVEPMSRIVKKNLFVFGAASLLILLFAILSSAIGTGNIWSKVSLWAVFFLTLPITVRASVRF